ncbi:MAG: hypothetical protein IKZ76_01240 [Lachnospiraceae bacterium]|nr:hypothetical protein [Lachnospiraceae bacterium]
MKKFNITYLIGIALIVLIIFEFVRMILHWNSMNIIDYIPETLCYIGGIVFVLGRIFGFMPVGGDKRELFYEIVSFLFKYEYKKENYRVPDELYKRIKADKRDEEALNLLAKDIVSFCDVDCTDLIVTNQSDLVEAAGIYSSESNEIRISLSNTRTADEVIAVLIHECMHYILRQKRLWLENTMKNEYLTDIACLFYGFDEYINKGYVLVGYLKRNEIRYIKELIREFDE